MFSDLGTHLISYMISYHIIMIICDIVCFVQEVVIPVAPFPNNLNPVAEFDVVHNFDVTGNGLMWYALPQLFFNCTLFQYHVYWYGICIVHMTWISLYSI
jgi:hypothetical protein